MTRILLLIVLLPSLGFAANKKWSFPENPKLDDELTNVYRSINATPGGIYKTSSMTLLGLTASSATISSLTVSTITFSSYVYTGGTLGSVLKSVNQFTTTTDFSTTSSGFQTSNLLRAVVPTATTTRFVVIACGTMRENAVAGNFASYSIFRDTTNLCGANGCAILISNGNPTALPGCIQVNDNPGVTSSITYSLKVKSDGTNTSDFGNGQDQYINIFEYAP